MWNFCILLLPLVFGISNVAAQIPTVSIPVDTEVKVKLARKLISGRVRIGDLVPFTVVEDVLVSDANGNLTIAIKGNTSATGSVIDRKHRVAIFRSGKFAVKLEKIRAADGTDVDVFIKRPQGVETCKDRITTKAMNPANPSGKVECVKGRTYSGSITSSLPGAIVAALTAGALVIIKDSTAKAAAAVTLAQQIGTQSGLSTILNGVDAEMDDGEILIAVVKRAAPVKGKTFVP
jgi:hypothetical protein